MLKKIDSNYFLFYINIKKRHMDIDKYKKELAEKGYTVIPSVLSSEEVAFAKEKFF